MKKLLFLILTLIPIISFSQRKWETGLSIGIDKSNYIFNYELASTRSIGIGLSQSWYKESGHRFTLVKECGLAFKYANLNYSYGGLAAGGNLDGYFLRAVASVSILPQMRFGNKFFIQLGPRVEGMLAGYKNYDTGTWCMPEICSNFTPGPGHDSGFSRDYFDQIYYGISFRIIKTLNTNRVGLSANLLRTVETDEQKETDKVFGLAVMYFF